MPRFVERHLHFMDFAIGSMYRRKGKYAALGLVYMLVVFVLASVLFYTSALRREAIAALSNAPEIIVQRTMTGRYAPIPSSYADKIGTIRGVLSAKNRLWGYYYDNGFEANYTLSVPLDCAPRPGEVFIGSAVARSRGIALGDLLPLTASDGLPRTFTISRIFSKESALLNADMILMSETDYRAFYALPESLVNDVILDVRNKREYATIAEKIKRMFPDARPILRTEILNTYDAIFSWRSGIVVLAFGGAILAFFIFAFDKASGISAEDKREIGILKSTGWDTSDVLYVKFWEGIVISLTAFLSGILAAYIHVFFGGALFFEPVIKGWSTLYPAFTLTPYLSLSDLMSLFFLSVVPFTIVTIAPSWKAAITEPDSAMR